MHFSGYFEVAFTQRKYKIVVVMIIEAAAGVGSDFDTKDFCRAIFQLRVESRIVFHGNTSRGTEPGRRGLCGIFFSLRGGERRKEANAKQLRQKCKPDWHRNSL